MNELHTIPGVRVGHAHNLEAATGCTVILTTGGAVGGVDVRGGAPGTRETDLLHPTYLVEQVHAVLLTGGSAFGLAAADGVMRWLEERAIGYDTGVVRVPIVPAAVIFDLGIGQAGIRPDGAMGYAACDAAQAEPPAAESGSVGAGAGATVGKILGPQGQMKGGLGQAVIKVKPGVFVGALIVVNCLGDVTDPDTGQIIAGARRPDGGGFANAMEQLTNFGSQGSRGGNTVVGAVVTNASLTKEAANRVAQMAHDGLARTIRPVHTLFDGDTIFALSTGQQETVDTTVIGALAAEAVAQAVVNGVRAATSLAGAPAVNDLDRP